MCKKMSLHYFIATALFATNVSAQPLVPNYSFELPGITSTSVWAIYGWDGSGRTQWLDNTFTTPGIDIPDWNSDILAPSSGVISSKWIGSTDGFWIGFMGPDDPPAWNLLYYKIKTCDQLIMSIDAVDAKQYKAQREGRPAPATWAKLQMTLYYEVDGSSIPAASQKVELTAEWQTYTLTFTANDVPDSIGNRLGIALQSDGMIGLDNVRFESPSQCPTSPPECPPCLCFPTTIEWVNEYKDVDVNGVTPDDQGWIDFLRAQGYKVSVRADSLANQYYWGTLDVTKIGQLNAADLVIISRLTSREYYDDVNEPNQWNAVLKPMMIINPAVTMNNCWRILNNATQINLQAPKMQVVIRDHPIFTGLTIDSGNQVQILNPAIGYRKSGAGWNGCTTFLDATSPGNGTLIATVAGSSRYSWIAEWHQVPSPYYPGGNQKIRGHRMTFFAGTQNNTSPGPGIPPIGQGVNNLNAAGQRLFLNAVKYMLAEPIESEPSIAEGSILFEYYWGTTNSVSSLLDLPTYPNNPDQTELRTSLEGPTDWRDSYGTRVRGYLYPPATGAFTFWIASDDQSELWLSPDEDAAKAVRIASVPYWTPPRDFDNTGGGGGGPQQKSRPIQLAEGRRYYIQVLHAESTYGDNVAVAWQGPGILDRAVIEGQYLSPP